MRYSHTSIIEWFNRSYGITNMPNKYEIQTNCPYCNHKSFFFNLQKQVGFCHRDSCHKTPNLNDLIQKIGYAPDQYGLSTLEEERENYEVTLPGKVLIWREGEDYLSCHFDAVTYLRNRGLTDDDIIRFGITFDGSRVYVPVSEKERIVNYVGRDITGKLTPKYKYCPGQKTSKHIFGWDECQYWENLTIVENTFVSIWLRNYINCTTVFGSHLSKTQADMISKSNVKNVVIMWDEDAETKAEKAVDELSKKWVNAIYVAMKGQPDDHPLEILINIRANALKDIGKKKFIDPFGRFPNRKGIIK